MDLDSQTQVYEYTLNVISIKMEVNFPCKMKVQHNSVSLTTEVPSNGTHKFAFNQEISIREEIQKQSFQLQVCLVTQKGAKYTAGIIKLFHNQLIRSQGERIVIALARCLDKQAFCELKIDQVLKSKITRRPQFGRSIKQNQMPTFDILDTQNLSPSNNRLANTANYNVVAQTKSQFQFPINNQRNRNLNLDWDNKSRQNPQSYYQRNPSKSPNTRSNMGNNRSRVQKPSITQQRQSRDRFTFQLQQELDVQSRDRLIQAEVYKQGYLKLKEKYKKQAQTAKNELNKRIQLQNSQNSLKLQIMKYKLKSDQLEKSNNDKNLKIKDLQNQLSILQQKQMQIQYLKQDINQKDHSIRVLQDTIRQINHQNEELKNLNQNRYTSQTQKISQLKHEIDSIRGKYQSKIHQLQKSLKFSNNQASNMQKQLLSLNNIMQQERITFTQLQKTYQSKIYDIQKTLSNTQTTFQSKIDELKQKFQKSQKQSNQRQTNNKQLLKQNQKHKTNIMKLQYDKRILTQDNQSLKAEYADVKIYKQKYAQLFREHRFVIQEKHQFQKQLQKTITNKQINLQEMNLQFNDQVEYYKRINRELDDRGKTYSNKIIQIQGQMDIVKSQSQKIRRNNQNLIKDLAEAKEKQKQAKKGLKTKQQQILSLEAEYSTIRQKSKNIDQIYKLETDKLKDQIDKFKVDLQNEYIKSSQLSQSNTQMAMELSKLRIKLQYTQERLQKDTINLRDRQSQLQNLIKDYQMQISSLEQNVNSLRLVQKQLSTKLSKLQIQLMKSEDNSEKKQKQIKLLQDKYINTQNTVRVKQQQISNLQYDREELQKRLNQLENDYTALKSDQSLLNNQKNKGLKVIQIYEEDLKKARNDIQALTSSLNQKQKQYDQLKAQTKSFKQELMKNDMKYSTLKKQSDRFRQSLVQTINGSFIPVLSAFTHPHSQQTTTIASKVLSSLNSNELDRNRRLINESTSSTQIISLIISHSKDTKLLLTRQFQQLKHLQKQTQRLTQQHNHSTNKHQSSQYQLHRTIQQLQQQLSNLLTQKQQQSIKYQHMIQQMSQNIRRKQNDINDLHQEIEEFQFTMGSVKMDHEQINQSNMKRISQLKKQKNQLQERLEDMSGENVDIMDAIEKLKIQLQTKGEELHSEKQTVVKLNQSLNHLKEQNSRQQQSLEQFKRGKKQLLQKISSLQLYLSSQSQLKSKTQSLLSDEQRKSQQQKQFITNLMKEKEQVIKSEILKSQQIMHLETQTIQLQRDNQLLKEENQRIKKNIDQLKQQLKQNIAKCKDFELELTDQKSYSTKTTDKLKQKQKQLINLTDNLKKLQAKYQKYTDKSKLDKKSLQEELQQKNQQLKTKMQQSNQKIINYQKLIHEKQSKILTLENKVTELQEENFAKNQQLSQILNQLEEKTIQLEEYRAKLEEQLNIRQDMLDQIKQKQENMFELSGKMYNMQLRLAAKQVQIKEKLSNLDNQWIQKYQSVQQEYQQRLQLIQKQRDYFKKIIDEKQQQIKILKTQSKSVSVEESTIKRTLEEKIKKVQQDRLQLFTLKTAQIQKLSQQNKHQFEIIRQKQSQHRRVVNQLEIARASINKMEQKNKDFQDKIKNVNKVYNLELQQLKKKQQAYKGFKQWVTNQQWSMQRQIRKLIQGFIKKFLQNVVVDQRQSTKMVQLVKSFEITVIDSISQKLTHQ